MIDQENETRRKAAAEQVRKDKAKEQERTRHEALRAPFKALAKRNSTALDTLGKFVKGGNEWQIGDSGVNYRRQAKVIILGDAKVTPATPDHMTICIASTQKSIYTKETEYSKETYQERKTKAVFNFAVIPRDILADVVGAEGHPLNSAPSDETIQHQESSLSEVMLDDRLHKVDYLERGRTKYRNPRTYKKAVHAATDNVKRFEHVLEAVLTAAANPELNPHLQQPIQELGSIALSGSKDL